MRVSGPTSKFFAAGDAREFIPINVGGIQRVTDQRLGDAARFQFLLNTPWPVAARSTTTDKNLGITIVFLEALVSQVVERIANIVGLKPFCCEFAFQLAATVFAPRQRADREVARAPSRRLAQASSNSSRSSSTALGATALDVIATARMLASISAATLGLSFRY